MNPGSSHQPGEQVYGIKEPLLQNGPHWVGDQEGGNHSGGVDDRWLYCWILSLRTCIVPVSLDLHGPWVLSVLCMPPALLLSFYLWLPSSPPSKPCLAVYPAWSSWLPLPWTPPASSYHSIWDLLTAQSTFFVVKKTGHDSTIPLTAGRLYPLSLRQSTKPLRMSDSGCQGELSSWVSHSAEQLHCHSRQLVPPHECWPCSQQQHLGGNRFLI